MTTLDDAALLSRLRDRLIDVLQGRVALRRTHLRTHTAPATAALRSEARDEHGAPGATAAGVPGDSGSAASASAAAKPSSGSHSRAVSPVDVARVCVPLGVCVRCTLRILGAAPTFVYALPYADIHAAWHAALTALDTQGNGAPSIAPVSKVSFPRCRACVGLLQGHTQMLTPAARTRMQEGLHRLLSKRQDSEETLPDETGVPRVHAVTAASVLDAAAGIPGTGVPLPEGVGKGDTYEYCEDWSRALALRVLDAGYDLRGGIGVAVANQTTIVPDESIETHISAASAAVAAELGVKYVPFDQLSMKDVLRGMVAQAMQCIWVLPDPRDALVPRVRLREEGDAPLMSTAPSGGATVDGFEEARMLERMFDDDGQVPPAATCIRGSNALVDLGWGVSGLGRTSADPDLDDDDETSASLVRDWQARGSMSPASAEAEGASRIAVSTHASLALTVILSPSSVLSTASGAATKRAREHAADAAAAEPDLHPVTMSYTLERGALFLKAHYCKYARGLSQSDWVVKGKRLARLALSVEETVGGVIADVFGRPSDAPAGAEIAIQREQPAEADEVLGCLRAIRSSKAGWIAAGSCIDGGRSPAVRAFAFPAASNRPLIYRFHSAGREDVDVRMLGGGRPMMVELIDSPHAVVPLSSFQALQQAVNAFALMAGGTLEIKWLRPANRVEFEALQSGAMKKRKTYLAMCWCSKPQTPAELRARLDALTDVKVTQRTPMRVMHRRSVMDRKKTVHCMKTHWINPWFFELQLETSAGAYVKEFVHGDLGRTRPNVGDLLGCEADILQLDVLGVRASVDEDAAALLQTATQPRDADDDDDDDDGDD